MATQYATRSDLEGIGINPVAFQGLSDATVNANLLAASEEADMYLRARYALPLESWGSDLKKLVCKVAAYSLMGVRGYNPGAGADGTIRQNYEDAVRVFEGVARQAVHLDVVVAFREGSKQQIPQVLSHPPRRW